jgi:hypothetical protein
MVHSALITPSALRRGGEISMSFARTRKAIQKIRAKKLRRDFEESIRRIASLAPSSRRSASSELSALIYTTLRLKTTLSANARREILDGIFHDAGQAELDTQWDRKTGYSCINNVCIPKDDKTCYRNTDTDICQDTAP